jgi:anti-sigma factor ChrR (cupin superfamily)
MIDDPFTGLAEAYALDVLDPEEREAFRGHLAGGCTACEEALALQHAVVGALPQGLAAEPLPPEVRAQILDLARAPSMPIDLAAVSWDEVAPGIRLYVLEEEKDRGVRKCLAWASPGARTVRHRHLGDELILVLQGGLQDHRGRYYAGDICHSRSGSVHTEEVLGGEDCVCYVVYYGPLEPMES